MSEGAEELSEAGVFENQHGLILGCWDHEKTATLIRDLEYSVNSVQRQCIQLFEELIHYKKNLEESGKENFSLVAFNKKTRKSKNCYFFSGSEPDIAFRKNLFSSQEIRVFEEKFQAKLCNINKELGEAAHKIGLKDNIILLHSNDRLKTLKKQTESGVEKSCSGAPKAKFCKPNFLNDRTESDPILIGNLEEVEFSKITKNELELYQKLSRFNMNKRKKKKKLRRRNMKFCLKRGCRQDFLTCKTESKKQKTKKNKLNKSKRATVSRRQRSRSPQNSFSTKYSQENINETEIEKMCKSLSESLGVKKQNRSQSDVSRAQEAALEGNNSLSAIVRKTVPFTACSSTSKSHNIGLNIQQLLFLSKHGKKPKAKTFALEKSSAATKIQSTLSEDGISPKKTENELEKGHIISWSPNSKYDGFEKGEVSHVEHKRRVWISDHSESNFRKVRSKYTGSSSEGILEYHKSTMRQYTNGPKSMIKSESKRAYAVGSKIMVSDCQRTDVFEIRRDKSSFENAYGDCTFNGGCNKLSNEWTKIYSSFLAIYRKYTSLKEKLAGNHLRLDDEELESLENDIGYSIEKYKDFLQFYSKFLQLNHRLKTLKTACHSKMFGPVISPSSNFRGKSFSCRPTVSATMKRALREVQTLQEKIKLVNG